MSNPSFSRGVDKVGIADLGLEGDEVLGVI